MAIDGTNGAVTEIHPLTPAGRTRILYPFCASRGGTTAVSSTVMLRRLGIFVALACVTIACRRESQPPQLDLIDMAVTTLQQTREPCDVAGDSRDSLILAAGQAIALPVRVPARSTLEYAVTTRGAGAGRANFELMIEDQRTHALVHADVQTATARWMPYQLDLNRFGGRTIVLHARTSSVDTDAPLDVCWGRPILITRGGGTSP